MTKPEPVDALPGMNVSFTSVIRGTPPFKVHWFKGSSEIIPGITCVIKLKDSAAILELYEVDIVHSGDYTCVVANDAGKDSCTTRLFVKGNFIKTLFTRTLNFSVFRLLGNDLLSS